MAAERDAMDKLQEELNEKQKCLAQKETDIATREGLHALEISTRAKRLIKEVHKVTASDAQTSPLLKSLSSQLLRAVTNPQDEPEELIDQPAVPPVPPAAPPAPTKKRFSWFRSKEETAPMASPVEVINNTQAAVANSQTMQTPVKTIEKPKTPESALPARRAFR